jgi:hypothetical protein
METNIVLLYSSKSNLEEVHHALPDLKKHFESFGANCHYNKFCFLPGQLYDWEQYSADLNYEKTYGVLVTDAKELVRGLSPYATIPQRIIVPSQNLDEQVLETMVAIQSATPEFLRNNYKDFLKKQN